MDEQEDPVSYTRSFLAGFDPTGTDTFNLAQKATRGTGHQVSGFLGGALGGATIIPAAVGAISKTISRRGRIGGAVGALGKAKELFSAVGSGAVAPFANTINAARYSRALGKAIDTGETLKPGYVKGITKMLGNVVGSPKLENHTDTAVWLVEHSNNPLLAALHSNASRGLKSVIDQQKRDMLLAIGSSAAVGAGSSVLQYNQGKKVGDRLREAGVTP